MEKMLDRIESYWSTRVEGYSEVNQKELEGMQKQAWLQVLEKEFPPISKEEIKILDVGTGPGFFPRILAEAGYSVTAVDYTSEMLEKAGENAGEFRHRIQFYRMDAQNLEFEDAVFDVVISRNLTWNLEKPEQAYKEWFRVLKPGGILLNFDANWYGYLYDEEKREAYEQDRKNVEASCMEDHYLCTDIDTMEQIALEMPLSARNRPLWDEKILKKTGFASVKTDPDIWKQVWSQEEKLNYGSTPMFMITCEKAKDFVLGSIRVKPGETFHGWVHLAGGRFPLPVSILHGTCPGKTMLVTAGVHAGEYVGIQAAIELAQELNPKKINGTVIIVKVINREGFECRGGSLGVADQLNLNREFPGDPKGTPTQQLAWAISSEIFPLADFYMDLHCGDDYEELTPYVYYAGKAEEAVVAMSRKMAEQVDVPYMVRSMVGTGGAYNYAASAGIPSILLERGGMGAWTMEEVRSDRRDVRNILCALGIYQGQRDYRKYYPLDVVDVQYQAASYGGCWYPRKKPGDMVVAREVLGEVRDYEGNCLETCRAEFDGVILYQTGSLQVLKEGPMIAYGRIVRNFDERKERITEYWTKRSDSFLEQRRAELKSPLAGRWLTEIQRQIPTDRKLRILDVGCGSGFFSILLAKQGYDVTGTDLTPEMVVNSKKLAKEEGVDCRFLVMDAEKLEFADAAFDVVISRNLTWTLPYADVAYKEWKRVLKPGGILLNFDANYGASDFSDTDALPENHAHHTLGDEMMQECEELKRQLPISTYVRPAWDLDVLGKMGFQEFSIDLGVSRRVYLERDEFYNPTPMFMLCGRKSE